MKKIEFLYDFTKNMGFRYVLYRIRHELEKKSGLLKGKHPSNPDVLHFISLDNWRNTAPAFVIPSRKGLAFPKTNNAQIKDDAIRLLNGDLKFFSFEWKSLGLNYDWITNPDSGYKYDVSKHWSEIPDMSGQAGDIKYVWEKSRFSYLLGIIRNDYNFDEDHSEYVFSQIEDWIDNNPVNMGPNWRCSQEISLRVFNWCYALYFYMDSPALNEARWNKIQNVIYWSGHHVYTHINFSRIAVRNNHAITETLFLTVSELLFPFIKETKRWSSDGRKWFEQEIGYQIYNDGTFLQFSMNYHRVVVQLLSFGLSITQLHKKEFSANVYDRALKSLDFLYQCLDEKTGWLPNYGSNDGALFFNLTSSDYRDYRPQLNTLHVLLTGKQLFNFEIVQEDSHWTVYYTNHKTFTTLLKKQGPLSYPIGGFYLLREGSTLTFIRCGNHNDRPAQADNLHLDVWVDGRNILWDSGTYKYNTDKNLQGYFTGTASHNSVMVENHSQMLKGGRFIWFFWTQAINASWIEHDGSFVFEGKVSAFRFLNKNATHRRVLTKFKSESTWIVEDSVNHLDNLDKSQLWHYEGNIEFESFSEGLELKSIPAVSYKSDYYGVMENSTAISFSFNKTVTTKIKVIN